MHAYYYLHEPYAITPENVAGVEEVITSVQRALASDYVQDVSRVMRLPGSWNNKNRGNPSRAFIVYSNWWERYTLADIDKAFKDLPLLIEGVNPPEKSTVPQGSIAERAMAAAGWIGGFTGRGLDVDDLWARTRYGDGNEGIHNAQLRTTASYHARNWQDDDIVAEVLRRTRIMVCGEQMEERQMVQAITVGLDIAKNVFHAYGVDAAGVKAFSRKLRRSQVEAFFAKLEPCLIGIEACATAHHWARTLETWGIRFGSCPQPT